jgi:hypothetical protein
MSRQTATRLFGGTAETSLAQIVLFLHQRHPVTSVQHGAHGVAIFNAPGDTFDIADAVTSLSDSEISNLKIVFVPDPLLTVPGKKTVHIPTLRRRPERQAFSFLLRVPKERRAAEGSVS